MTEKNSKERARLHTANLGRIAAVKGAPYIQKGETMNKNEWLVSWSSRDIVNKQECQYIADVVMLLQKEVLALGDLKSVKVEPINREGQP